jgi:hypothetical protein
MVNGGFPANCRYGFEMVDGRLTRLFAASIKNLRRIKSTGFFANYSRFNFKANTSDLSTPNSVAVEKSAGLKATEQERRPE